MNLLSARREVGEFKKRYKWMALVVLLAFGVLFARMVQLQLAEYDLYQGIAEENITRTLTLPATRGILRDHNGRVIATNRPAYNVYLTPQYLEEGDVETIATLMGLADEDATRLQERLDAVPARRRAQQIRAFTDVSRDQLAALETHQQDLCVRRGSRDRPVRLPCVTLLSEPVRTYPYGRLGSHVIGYLNEMTAEELDRLREDGYRLGDRIGRTGLERAWEAYLRGRRGFRRVLVDARGRLVETGEGERRREPVPGRDLTLTLDMGLMRIVDRVLYGYRAGVAVVDVNTGAVRALYSRPSYDLNAVTAGLNYAEYAELRDDPFRPLIDRTVYESYFPGSTFKPIAALAGLQDGLIDPADDVECTGSYTLGNTRFGCTSSHGDVDLHESLVQSCNVYFYRLAERIGIDRLARFAGDFGLGRRTGVGINAEAAGFIPTRAWYERVGRRFRVGYTLNNTIGQGDTKVTLVQLATAYAAIANGGTLYVPQLVEQVTGPDGTVVEEFAPRIRRRVHVDPAHLARVREGLVGVVTEPTGTAHDAYEDLEGDVRVAIAGKTGTAQVSRRARPNADARLTEYLNRAHAWFAGYAPADDPELAIVVLVEHGGPGGRYAAPLAMRILQEYLGSREDDGRTASLAGRRRSR
jgi:penicillin-binding protein 2